MVGQQDSSLSMRLLSRQLTNGREAMTGNFESLLEAFQGDYDDLLVKDDCLMNDIQIELSKKNYDCAVFWSIFRVLLIDSTSGIDSQIHEEDKQDVVPMSDAQKVDSLLKSNKILRRIAAVKSSLETTLPPIQSPFTPSLVVEPCSTIDTQVLTSQNEEKIINVFIFEHLRRGNVNGALQVCFKANQPWKAAIIIGGQYWDGIDGNNNRSAWRQACLKLIKSPVVPSHEAVIYAVLIGHLATLQKHACFNWTDALWVKMLSHLDEGIELHLRGQENNSNSLQSSLRDRDREDSIWTLMVIDVLLEHWVGLCQHLEMLSHQNSPISVSLVKIILTMLDLDHL